MRTPSLVPLSALLLLTQAPSPPAAPPTELAAARALYLEDAVAPRPVAEVRARVLVDGAGAMRLEVTIGPCGAGVEPLPGFAGVPGTNLRTAEELDRLLADGALRLVTRHGGSSHPGVLARILRRRLPARIVEPSGRLAEHTTAAAWPVEVAFRSVPLPADATWSYLESEGVPRLAVHVVRDGAKVAIAIASLAEPVPQPRVEVRR